MNKYELNYLQWLTGLPRKIVKTVTDLKWKDDKTITYKCKIPFKDKDWRMVVGHSE